MVRKANFLNISVLLSEIVILCLKRKVLYEFPQKSFKTTERHSLAVCGSICVEKHFLLIFSLVTGLIKNICLNKSKFSSGFAPFKHGKKNKFLSVSVLISEIATFLTKKRCSLWISRKLFQNHRRAYFISEWLTLWRKTFFVNNYPLLLVWSKNCLNNPN